MATRYDPDQHHRRSIRLPGYDYRQAGAYFVTICTCGRECVLNDPIVEGIVTDVWQSLPARFPTIVLDEFVVMPNHVHLIVWLRASNMLTADPEVGATLAVAPDRAGASPAPTMAANVVASLRDWIIPETQAVNMNPTLGQVMGTFKSLVFTVYLNWIKTHGLDRWAKFWQRNYFEHIIRNERELNAIRQYIIDNPDRWAWDTHNPSAVGPDPRAVELWRMLQENQG